jgi:hypothetical protein
MFVHISDGDGPLYQCPFSTSFSPFVSTTTGIGIGPPGEPGSLAVNISTPSAVTSKVCSVSLSANDS